MGLGHLCGGGGIRGETVEYGTEYGVTAGDLCVLVPADETGPPSFVFEDFYINPLRFQRSNGEYVYFYGEGNLLAQVETENLITIFSSTSTDEYYIIDGYLVKPNVVHLYVYNYGTPGFKVLEIDISGTPTITKTVFTYVNAKNTFPYPTNLRNSNQGYALVYKVGTNKYVLWCNNYNQYSVVPIWDDGTSFKFGNVIIGAHSKGYYHTIAGNLSEEEGVIVFAFSKVTKYVYNIENTTPELTATDLTLQNVAQIVGDRYSNKNFVYSYDNHYIVVDNSESGVYVMHCVLSGNTLTQIGAKLAISPINRVFVALVANKKLFVYSDNTSTGTPYITKIIIDVSSEPIVEETIERKPNLYMYSGHQYVTDTRYIIEPGKLRTTAYQQYGWTNHIGNQRYINTFKPLDSVESSPNALYAMGSVAADNYGKFRVQPKEG